MLEYSDFAEAIAKMNQRDHKEPSVHPDTAIMWLREAAERYADMARGPRFKVGDLVHPFADASFAGRGTPHLVLTVRERHDFEFGAGSPGSILYGRWLDMRVIRLAKDGLFTFWVESAEFERWA